MPEQRDDAKKSKTSFNNSDSLSSSPRTPLEETRSVASAAIEEGRLSLNNSSSRTQRRVSFSPMVRVREYNVILGDADVLHGFPISIDWKHAPEKLVDIIGDDYSHQKSRQRGGARAFPKPLTVEERQCRLRHMGYTTVALRQQETQRKIRLTFNWAYGNSVGENTPPRMSKDDTIYCIQHYLL